MRRKVEIREQLALLVQDTEEEEEKEMKRQHTESLTGTAAENEKRAPFFLLFLILTLFSGLLRLIPRAML